jgi:hypothetical protein
MRTNGFGKPVVALDIDGTLGDFHGNFLKFARLYFDRPRSDWATPNPGLPMWEWMGLDHAEYVAAKLAYRQGGWKRWMPCYLRASALTHGIRRMGAEVWICTTRPYLRLDNVDPDTREWLRRNDIQYDAVLFDRIDSKGSKYAELKEQAGDRVASILDDLPEMVNAAADLWTPEIVTIRTQPYNLHFEWERRVNNNDDAYSRIIQDLASWERRRNE